MAVGVIGVNRQINQRLGKCGEGKKQKRRAVFFVFYKKARERESAENGQGIKQGAPKLHVRGKICIAEKRLRRLPAYAYMPNKAGIDKYIRRQRAGKDGPIAKRFTRLCKQGQGEQDMGLGLHLLLVRINARPCRIDIFFNLAIIGF